MNKIIIKYKIDKNDKLEKELDLDTLSIDKFGPYFVYHYKGIIKKPIIIRYYDLAIWSDFVDLMKAKELEWSENNNQKCIDLMKDKYPEWFLKI